MREGVGRRLRGQRRCGAGSVVLPSQEIHVQQEGQGDVKDITGIAQRTLSSSMGFAERLSQRLLWHTVGQ